MAAPEKKSFAGPLTPLLLCRPLLSERSVLERADGSAKWVQDGSAVLAAVHGPTQAGQRREDAERAVVEVVFTPRSGHAGGSMGQHQRSTARHCSRHAAHQLARVPQAVRRQNMRSCCVRCCSKPSCCCTTRAHSYSWLCRCGHCIWLHQACSSGASTAPAHARTPARVPIPVGAQVLQADGALLAVSINAVCAALADAGIPMKHMFGECSSCSCPRQHGSGVLRQQRVMVSASLRTAVLRLPAVCLLPHSKRIRRIGTRRQHPSHRP